ncbi:manganese efflux pump MntP [Desulfonatronum thioautotrophicum]|uniref:manganese efflux pump MntP n=1 Tax=Desulfonatronum thioautotrophicum TaxID=617001 RepID=UPI0005EBDD8E|nr:manganese efflux pump [Desulfonatronum thioautotrophicum]
MLSLIILGVVIGFNNFAVALTLGAMGQAPYRYRVMFVFGVFEFMIPLLGIHLGLAASRTIGLHANTIGAVLLFGIGLFAVFGGLRNNQFNERMARLVVTWSGLLMLAAGLSLDNLMAGFSLGLNNVQPLLLAGFIAFFSVSFTWLGMVLGRESRRSWERISKISSGTMLMVLAVAVGAGWFESVTSGPA